MKQSVSEKIAAIHLDHYETVKQCLTTPIQPVDFTTKARVIERISDVAPNAHHKIMSKILVVNEQYISLKATFCLVWAGPSQFIDLHLRLNLAMQKIYECDAPDLSDDKLFASAINTLLLDHIQEMQNTGLYSTNNLSKVISCLKALLNDRVYIVDNVYDFKSFHSMNPLLSDEKNSASNNSHTTPQIPTNNPTRIPWLYFKNSSTIQSKKSAVVPSTQETEKSFETQDHLTMQSSQALIKLQSILETDEHQPTNLERFKKEGFTVVNTITQYGLSMMGINVPDGTYLTLKELHRIDRENKLKFHPDRSQDLNSVASFRDALIGHWLVLQFEYPENPNESKDERNNRLVKSMEDYIIPYLTNESHELKLKIRSLIHEINTVRDDFESRITKLENNIVESDESGSTYLNDLR